MVIGSISETMDLYGVTPSVGRLYGAMYFHKDPMTLDEMKEELGMSKPSMSTAVRKLQENEMVQKAWKKGERKDMYIAEKDFFKSFAEFFCKKWEKEVTVNLEATVKAEAILEEILLDPEVSEETRQETIRCYTQLKESKVYYKWLKSLVDSFRTGDIYNYLPKDRKK
ncbi:choline update/conversion transcriptional regulator CudC [Alkalihalobacillus sp. BA299]|uniref:choline uptake/conversion transcriptional regulator CudC n=1 Tax=Alkalihalobacillus sp. BA299 TaxID=2815938 RepID=UPI001ADA6B3F